MFNVLIFIIGAGIMFYMGLRSVLQRRRLQQKGQRVEARVAGTVQSRDGTAYLLEFETEGGSHRLHYPKAAKGKGFASGETVTLYYDPDDPVKMGFVQALGVLIDTVVICSCTAFMMLLAPANVTTGLTGMDLLQAAVQYHLGSFGVVFIAVTLALFSFSTFIGILFYARSNVAYLFGDRWGWQTAYKVLALVMLMVGGLEAYTVVWDLGDVGIGLMTIFNLIALYPMSGEAITALRDYERRKHLTQN